MRNGIRNVLGGVILLGVLGNAGVQAEPISVQPPAQQPSKTMKEIEEATESFRKQDFDGSYRLLQEAVRKNPDLAPARLLLAKFFLQAEQPDAARIVLEQAVAENPGHPEAYLIFGSGAIQQGRLSDAALNFEKALLLARSEQLSAGARRNYQIAGQKGLAAVAERRNDWLAAETALTAFLELEPRTGQARRRLGLVLFRRGNSDQAARELEKASADDASLEPAAITLAWLWTEEGNLKKAEESLERAVKNDPKSPRPRLSLAAWLLEQNRSEEAQRQAEAAAKLGPETVEGRALRGLIAWHRKDYMEAERVFLALYLESPGQITFRNQLTLALAEQKNDLKRRRAFDLAEVNLQLDPNSAESLAAFGVVCYRLDKMEDAEKALRAALATGTARADTAYYLARVLTDRGQHEEAKQLLKLSLETTGRFAFRKEAQEYLGQLARKTVSH
jgi:tetratricopeptide (TPR) repeat protein